MAKKKDIEQIVENKNEQSNEPDGTYACPGCGAALTAAYVKARMCGACESPFEREDLVKIGSVNAEDKDDAEDEPISPNKGKITVKSQLHRLDPTISKDLTIEVEPFVTANVTVSRSYEYTIKGQDGYPMAKVSVFIAFPCYREEIEETLEAIKKRGREEIRAEIMAIKGQKPAAERRDPERRDDRGGQPRGRETL